MFLPITVGTSPTLGIRGIIATETLKKGTIIERCPLIFLPVEQEKFLKQTVLWKYYFEWTKKYHSIALGYGSLVNHSYEPNVQYIFDYRSNTLNFKVIRQIEKGEEVFVNYNGNPYSTDPISEELIDNNKHFSHKPVESTAHSLQGLSLPFTIGISPTLKIRGLIAERNIKKGETIERCPVVFFPRKEEQAMDQTVYGKYYFEWNSKVNAACFGYGALINHSYTPNVYFGRSFKHNVLVFSAWKDIQKGDELMSNYNGYDEDSMNDPVDPEHVDFDVHHKNV